MAWISAIGVTLGVIVLIFILTFILACIVALLGGSDTVAESVGDGAGIVLILLTSLWVGIDAAAIEFRKYEGFLSGQPWTMALLCSMIWIVIFPSYLAKRWKITHGQAKLKPEFAQQSTNTNVS